MQLGVSTYTYPWMIESLFVNGSAYTALMCLLDKAIQHHINHVQVGDNVPLHLLSDSESANIIEKAKINGIGLEVGTKRLSYEHIINYIAIAGKFTSPFLRVVIDDQDFYPDEHEVINIIRDLLPAFKKSQVLLALENHDRFSAALMEKIILATDPVYVGVCLDTANSLGAGESIREVVKILAPYTFNLHIKDFSIKRVDHKMGFRVLGCAAGEGFLDIPWLVEQIQQNCTCKTATLEIWSDPKKNLHESIVQEEAWANRSIEYLKNHIK